MRSARASVLSASFGGHVARRCGMKTLHKLSLTAAVAVLLVLYCSGGVRLSNADSRQRRQRRQRDVRIPLYILLLEKPASGRGRGGGALCPVAHTMCSARNPGRERVAGRGGGRQQTTRDVRESWAVNNVAGDFIKGVRAFNVEPFEPCSERRPSV